MVKKYVKKPIVIEALKIEWGSRKTDLLDFAGMENVYQNEFGEVFIKTLEGNMKVSVGDYVIKGIEGEFYPCKPNIFKKTYSEVDE